MKKAVRQWMLWAERWERSLILGSVCFIVLLGIFYSYQLGDTLRYRDEEVYYRLAHNLASQGFYSLDGQIPTAYRPPGYPLLLSLLMLFGADIICMRILNFLALGGSIILVHLILKAQCSSLAGLIGALWVIGYPILFYTAGTLYPQLIGSFLFLLIIYNLFETRRHFLKTYLLGGFLFGLLILTIPSFIIPLVFTLLWLAFYQRSFKKPAMVFIMALLVIGIWSLRNYKVFNSIFFVSTNSGINLLVGNSENTTANSGVCTDISEYEENGLKMDEIKKDAFFRSRAMEFIRANKLYSIKLYFFKWLNHFNFQNDLKTQTESSWLKDLVLLLTYGPLLFLFIFRLLLFKRFRFTFFEIYLITLYFLNSFYQAVFFTRIRFRIPFDFLLILIVAMFLYNLVTNIREKPISKGIT